MRAMVANYSGGRVLIGETYLPNTAELDKWYGGDAHNELQLPMDMLIGFHGDHDKLDADSFRQHIEEVETQIHGSQPLVVFDNHDNVRAIDRYGDGVHDDLINKALATVLFTTKATSLMYYGEEIGMHTTTPTRREDVRDPIGITGWPKQKGRDGERTPMQWTAGPQAGFSTDPNTWLPIPPSYKTINVAVESKDPNSDLEWFKQLTTLRRDIPALHSGEMTMLDTANPDVLSYIRSTGSGPAVVVAMNFTATPETITLDLAGSGVTGTTVKTLAADDASLQSITSLKDVTLPPYASWVASVQ
jgi:alpha-glucosidase